MAIDLFCGLGGWTKGLLAAGWRVRGYDIDHHVYNEKYRYPVEAEFVKKDVMEINPTEIADADLIVASPPCQFFSFTSFPFTKSKELAEKTRNNPELLEKELRLFKRCFWLREEASKIKGKRIPMVVENVAGATKWVGRASGRCGSFFFWGDPPAIFPSGLSPRKTKGYCWSKKNKKTCRNRPLKDAIFKKYTDLKDFDSKTRAKIASLLAAHIPFEVSKYVGDYFLRALDEGS